MPGAAGGPYHPMRYVWDRDAYKPGVAVFIYLGSLFFRLFDVSAMCFKSMGIVLSLPILPLAYVLVARHIGREQARITALLVALPPAMYAKWNVKPYYFALVILANLAMAELALQIIFDRKAGFVRCGLLGLVGGLSLLNAPFGLPMMAAIGLVWLALGRSTLRARTLSAVAAGFLVGFSPLIFHDWRVNWVYLRGMFGRVGLAAHSSAAWATTTKLSYVFGQTAMVEGAAPHTVASLTYYAFFVAGVCWLGVKYTVPFVRRAVSQTRPSPPKGAFFLVYVLVYVLAWVKSPREMRYLIPIFPFALVAIAIMLCDVRVRAARAGLLLVVSAAGLFGILGFAQSPKHGWDRIDYWQPRYKALLALLDRQDVKAVYTSFFIGPHLMFDSRDAVVAYHGYVAWPEYRTVVDKAQRYAYLYEKGSYYDNVLSDALEKRSVKHKKKTISGINVYYALEPALRLDDIPDLDVTTDGAAGDEESLLASLRLDPGWTGRRVQLAKHYRRRGRHEEAIRQARDALRRDPKAAAAYILLGRIYQDLGDTAKRDEMWLQAERVDPRGGIAIRRLEEM